jgi:hypothetical protein
MSAASEALSSVPVSELTSVWRLPSIRYAWPGLPDWLAVRIVFGRNRFATGTVPCEALPVNRVVAPNGGPPETD